MKRLDSLLRLRFISTSQHSPTGTPQKLNKPWKECCHGWKHLTLQSKLLQLYTKTRSFEQFWTATLMHCFCLQELQTCLRALSLAVKRYVQRQQTDFWEIERKVVVPA